MLPRGKLDIGWSDIAFAIRVCLTPGSARAAAAQLEERWGPDQEAVATLSVRSGFDLLLRALALPPGSEVLVSAVTIRDMVRIIEHHRLVPVPVDLDVESLAIRQSALDRAWSRKARMILVAHLFGSRMPMEAVAAFAQRRGLLLVEDCAQAFTGLKDRGDSRSDVVLFSFGPIKTHTALGGGVTVVRDGRLRARMRELHRSYPVAPRSWFLSRVLKSALVMGLLRPSGMDALAVVSRWMGTNHDELVTSSLRGFPGPDFFERIRQHPPFPLLALLDRRLRRFRHERISDRAAAGELANRLHQHIERPGRRAKGHTHWVFPVSSRTPERLIRYLWDRGFDATRGASSLGAVGPAASRPEVVPREALKLMEGLVYLPFFRGVTAGELQELASAVAKFERSRPVDTGGRGDRQEDSRVLREAHRRV